MCGLLSGDIYTHIIIHLLPLYKFCVSDLYREIKGTFRSLISVLDLNKVCAQFLFERFDLIGSHTNLFQICLGTLCKISTIQ